MSTRLSRRDFLKIAGMTAIGGMLAACSKPTQEPTTPSETTAGPGAQAPPEETVILDYYWIGNQDTDQRSLVEAAINEYVEPLIGANVVFHIIGWGDWASKALTALQAGEKIDIIFTADWRDYMREVTDGLLRPLNDDNGEYGNLLQTYGQGILNSLHPAFIIGTQVDGVNYAVPTNKELTVPEGFVYNVALAEEIGMTEEDAANIKSFEDMEPWLAEAKKARPDEYPYLTDGRTGFMPWVPGFASGVSELLVNMKFAPNADGEFDETIVSVMETEWAKYHTKKMREWYDKGYIHPDVGLDTFDCSPIMNAGNFLVRPQPLKGNNIKAQELANASGNPDLRLGEIYGQPKINITTHAGGSMLAIPMVSEYAVQAMQYINLMHTDSKLVNMMVFGKQGTHWESEDDGRVNLIDSSWYGAHGGPWTVGDVLLQAVTNKEDPEKNKLLIEYSKDALNHASLGFRFRSDAVAAELTAVDAVTSGTQKGLFTGYIDPDEVLFGYISDLKDAGLDTVKAEVENQYAAWKEAKASQG